MCVSMQALAAILRPSVDAGKVRARWFVLHAGLGLGAMFLGGYVLHHSMDVFHLRRIWALPAYIGLGLMVLGILCLKIMKWCGKASGEEMQMYQQVDEVENGDGLPRKALDNAGAFSIDDIDESESVDVRAEALAMINQEYCETVQMQSTTPR